MESLWRKESGRIKILKEANQNEWWDVIIAGAGLAGLLTAYYLQQEGKRVLILEAKTVASGQTERTTAKITSQHDVRYSELVKKAGIQNARMYARANEEAIKEYERLIKERKIECQFEKKKAYLYTLKDEQRLREEARIAAALGIYAYFTLETELPFEVKGAVCFENQAQFSPLEFVQNIVKDLQIIEERKVMKVRGNKVVAEDTASGEICEFWAKDIVIATHYPVLNVPGFYFLRQHQERSYVLALEGCENFKNGTLENMYLNVDEEGFSFRQAGEVLLLGGGSHRTGECSGKSGYSPLEQAAEKYFPHHREVSRWSAQDCMPHDGIPFIGRYSMFTPNLYVATGFQKWGMTTSMVAAMVLRDRICELENPYKELFTPQRIYMKAGIQNLILDVAMSTKGLIKGLFSKPRCPHLGCELVWNPYEKTWDCPCHGSRFEKDGAILDNPAKKGIDKRNNR